MMLRSKRKTVGYALIGLAVVYGTSYGVPTPQKNIANAVPAGAATRHPAQHPTHFLVRFKPGMAKAVKNATLATVPGAKFVREYHRVDGLQLIDLPSGHIKEACETLRKNPNVRYAEPDFMITLSRVPNDPNLPLLWGMQNTGQTVNGDEGTAGIDIRAPQAWQVWTGDPSFRIAVIDSGVNYTHPDLAANVWTNPGEIPGNGIDDDGNGYVDDIHGYDFLNRDGDPMDDNGHGSHVSGTIGAVGDNGIGVVGVNWQCKIVGLKFLGAGGSGPVSAAIEGLQYAIYNNIRVSNNSWGSTAFSTALRDTIQAAGNAGHLFVAAAGNSSADNDILPHYPAAYDLDNIISVAAINNDGRLAGFSNYGAVSVDLAAPGVQVYSTMLASNYGYLNGTSMATPHVTGVAGLIMSRVPSWTWQQVRDQILSTAIPSVFLTGRMVTGGWINAQAAVGDCNENGIADDVDIATGTSQDCSGNGTPDECESDCNGNGLADSCDIFSGSSLDCSSNGIPDECEPDCNSNGRADSCDIFLGFDTDCDSNGVPDSCQPDCNGNGVADECDIRTGMSADCTGNGVPDECEGDCNGNGVADICDLNSGTSIDCTGNGIPDECDIAAGTSTDCTQNGVPDECEYDCNANGRADSCDIADGLLTDVDGDGIADSCKLGFAIVPVDATGPHTIEGDRIYLTQGDQRVTFEVRLSGWAPGGAADPPLQLYQAAIDALQFANGIGAPATFAKFPCTTDGQCRPSLAPPGTPRCIDGFCDDASAVFVDQSKPDYIFQGLNDFALTILNPGISPFVGAFLFSSPYPPDRGQDRYGATVLVDVPAAASGPYVIRFDLGPPDAETPYTFWTSDNDLMIPIRGLHPAAIVLPSDCDGDGVDDACETDCGVAGGRCDVPGCGLEADCNKNLIPDSCAGVEVDCNGNGVPDECDVKAGTSTDCNNNRVPDECEVAALDCNGNGVLDECDIASGTSADCTLNDIPDECETQPDCNGNGRSDENDLCDRSSPDCDGNLVPDECDLASGLFNDCNTNAVPDVCDITARTSLDCNANSVPDECDVAGGTSADCNGDGLPDECVDLSLDCNGNGTPDTCDVAAGASQDCNSNQLPDECEDCNNNGLADECDLAQGTSVDANGNGLPDECDFFLFVDQSATGANDGSDWQNAFNDLQDALDKAGEPGNQTTEIWIAKGVYHPDRGTGDRDATFQLVDGVTLYGGFAGGELLRSQRDPTLNETILCGDLLNDDALGLFDQAGFDACRSSHTVPSGCEPFDFDGDGNIDDDDEALGRKITDNTNRVVTAGEDVITGGLDGLTIRRAYEIRNSPTVGSGISNAGRLRISHCVITGNYSIGAYGTFGSTVSSLFTITDTTFRENLSGAFNDGGARADLINCTFIGNRGGISLKDNSTARNCLFQNNTVVDKGGALFVWGAQPVPIINCTFEGNHSDFRGGAVYVSNGRPIFSGCVFRNNTGGDGSAGYFDSGDSTLVNCLFSGNKANRNGGTIVGGYQTDLTFYNCTFSGNSDELGGFSGIKYSDVSEQGLLTVANSIFWGNVGLPNGTTSQHGQIYVGSGRADINYNCVENWTGSLGGVGNHGNDPLFADPDGPDNIVGTADDDLSLISGSPCIDAASNDLVPADLADVDADGDTSEQTPVDLLGTTRFLDDPMVPDTGAGFFPIVDMGAIEAGTDCNGNGIDDIIDIANGTSLDCSGNNIPDECEPDCNNSGTADSCDLLNGTSLDCNANQIPDDCDIETQRSGDCNSNGIPDECEPDGDSDGVIDDCDGCPNDPFKSDPGVCGCGVRDIDSDHDSVPNCVDICPGGDDLVDTDGDGVPNGCDVCEGFDDALDNDADTVPDGCDLCPGIDDRPDADGDTVPDCADNCPGFANTNQADDNQDGLGDVCSTPQAPQRALGEVKKERFIPIVVPDSPAGGNTALRITLDSLYHPTSPVPIDSPDFSATEGQVRYVNLLRDASGNPVTSCVSSTSFSTSYPCASVGCQPEYADWAGLFGGETIYVTGSSIIPDSTYRVVQLAQSCAGNESLCDTVSAELTITTARHGDVDDSGLVNVADVVSTVDIVKGGFGAPWEYQAYVRSNLPQPQMDSVNVTDIVIHVDAVKLKPYSLAITSCP